MPKAKRKTSDGRVTAPFGRRLKFKNSQLKGLPAKCGVLNLAQALDVRLRTVQAWVNHVKPELRLRATYHPLRAAWEIQKEDVIEFMKRTGRLI